MIDPSSTRCVLCKCRDMCTQEIKFTSTAEYCELFVGRPGPMHPGDDGLDLYYATSSNID